METTLQDSSLSSNLTPRVQVLLATYNGEKYLDEFLKSLLAQIGVHIHLIVSDDGSSDSTLRILGHYTKKFHTFTQLMGPRRGPAANFFFLLRHANSDYVAFADQDDVWLPNHLISSVRRLESSIDKPSLSYSAVLEFNSDYPTNSPRLWPAKHPRDSIQSRLFENSARGCTVVLNQRALELINVYEPNQAVMHDWWIYLLISATGVTNYGQDAEVHYRIHGNNVIGKSPSFGTKSKRFWGNLTRNSWNSIDQMEELFNAYQNALDKEKAHQIGSLLHDVRCSLLGGKLNLVFSVCRFRSKIIDEIIFRLTLLNPRLKKL